MMDIKDARKVINDLENKPFLCSDTEIQTESGSIITRKEVKKNGDQKRTEGKSNMHRSQA